MSKSSNFFIIFVFSDCNSVSFACPTCSAHAIVFDLTTVAIFNEERIELDKEMQIAEAFVKCDYETNGRLTSLQLPGGKRF